MNEFPSKPIFSSEPSTEALFLGLCLAEQISWLADKEAATRLELADGLIEHVAEPYRAVCAVFAAQGLIMNGNVQRFFEKDWPGYPDYSIFVNAYRAVGATESADCLADAVDQFDFPEPHRDYLARRRVMDGVGVDGQPTHANEVIAALGRRMMALDTLVTECLAAFVERHLEAFPSAARHFQRHAGGKISAVSKDQPV